MKACLVLPPIRDFYLSPRRLSGLGLQVLERLLNKNGWETKLFLCPLEEPSGRRLPLPEELAHLEEFLIPGETGPLSWFTSYKHFGPDFEPLARRIIREKPDLVFISSFSWAYAEEARSAARAIKKLDSSLPLVLGGGTCCVLPEYFLSGDEPGADFLFFGEAEPGLGAFLEAFAEFTGAGSSGRRPGGGPARRRELFSRIPNLLLPEDISLFREGEKGGPSLCPEKDLYPAWREMPGKRSARAFAVSLARGCPRGCRFCSNHLSHGRPLRLSPLERVFSLLDRVPEDGAVSVNFEDDNLLLARDYFLAILKSLKQKNPLFRFSCENGLDYSLLTPSLLTELRRYGLSQLNISLAVPDPAKAQDERRFLDWDHYQAILQTAAKLDLPVISYFICGLEGENPELIPEVLAKLSGLPTQAGISLFYPVPGLPGVPGFSRREDFLTVPPRLCAGSSAYPWSGSLSSRQMITAFRLARFINFLKKPVHSPQEKELLAKIQKEKTLYTFVKKGNSVCLTGLSGLDKEMIAAFFRRADAAPANQP